MTDTKAETTKAKSDRDATLRKAYSLAATELREKYRAEFVELQQKHAKALGIDWTPKPTAEEKAEEEARALLEKFPHLRDTLLGAPAGHPPVKEETPIA